MLCLIATGYTVVLYNLHKVYKDVTTEEEFLLGDVAGQAHWDWRAQTMISNLYRSATLIGAVSVMGIVVLLLWSLCFNLWRNGTRRSERPLSVELMDM